MNLTCISCYHEFEGTISFDELGWHSVCPECGNSFDVDVPEGKIIVAFTNPNYDQDEEYANFEQELPRNDICAYYAFASRKDFLDKWEEISENPPGMWYWMIEDGYCITNGACSPQDIELFCDAWGVEVDDSYDIDVLLQAARKSFADGKILVAIDIQWDADDPEDIEDLPTEIEIPPHITDEEDISDYITDLTGFCHKGFVTREKDV